jgi:hypothetical protein
MLKLFFWLLIGGNAALLAFRMGYMDSFLATKSESQRMENQLNADKIKLVDGKIRAASAASAATAASAASAASATPTSASTPLPASVPSSASVPQSDESQKRVACTEIGDFGAEDTKKVEPLLAKLSLGDRQAKRKIQEVATYMVYIPSKGNKAGVDKKAKELKEMGIRNFFIIQDNSKMRWGISLGVFKTEAAAKNHLANLKKQGVRSARIGARSVTGTRAVYSLRDLDEKTLAAVKEIMGDFPDQKIRDCKKE